jgi:hypothetical protein
MWAALAAIVPGVIELIKICLAKKPLAPGKPVQVDRAQVARDRAAIDAQLKK